MTFTFYILLFKLQTLDEIEEGEKESDLKECIKENNNEDEKGKQEKANEEDIITEQNEVVSLDETAVPTPVVETDAKLEPTSLVPPSNLPDFNELKKGREMCWLYY